MIAVSTAASAARTRNSGASVAMLRIGKREGLRRLGLHLRDPAKARSFSPQRRHTNPIILTISMILQEVTGSRFPKEMRSFLFQHQILGFVFHGMGRTLNKSACAEAA